MPLYDYRCKICENVFSYRHSHKELMVECESCEKETLEKVFGYTSNFVKKAHDQWLENNCTTVALLPARTDTKWFHNYIYEPATIIFIKGRLKFEGGEKLAPAPFPSMIVIWWGMEKINDQDFLSDEKLKKLINLK